jgi:hypothetical protein
VVQDQLRVSDGWVRCGRCAEVFDAREQLFDLDREAPPPWPAPSPQSEFGQPAQDDDAPEPPAARHAPSPVQVPRQAPMPMPAPASNVPAPVSATPEMHAAPHPAVRRPIDVAAERRADTAGVATPSPAAAPAEWHPGGTHAADTRPGERVEPFWAPPPDPTDEPPADAISGESFAAEVDEARADLPEPKGMRFDPEPAPELPASAPAPTAPVDAGPDVILSPRLQSAQVEGGATFTEVFGASADAPAEAAAAPVRKPGFLRRAEGEARWQRPGVRIALALGTLLLLGTAAAQLTWHYRDALAAQSPLARQWLGAACEKLGCTVQPWRRLDAFSVESTGLSEAASGNHYKFSLSLRNKSPWELATPWVELSLNDGNGKVLMKKALRPEDFANGRPATAATSEQSLQLVFSTGKQRVNGYTVEIFYP